MQIASEKNSPHIPITEIAPQRGWSFPDLREAWQYRHVLYNIVYRNFRVQYRQTIGGPIYAVYDPLMTMLGYTLMLNGLFKVDIPGIPYPIFAFSGLIIWTLFTVTLRESSMSLHTNHGLIQKIYIPRLIFPMISAAMALVNFTIAFGVLLILMLLFGVPLSFKIVFLPFFMLIALTCAFGIGVGFAGLHARFRDTQYLVGLMTRGLFFLTPIVYASRVYPAPWDQLYKLNPMAVVIEGMRWSVLNYGEPPALNSILAAVAMSLVLLTFGLLYFKRHESTIADVV